jgi:hypothetical protein
MGLWSNQAKAEGIVVKATWQWCINSSVLNDPLDEPGHTPLYVGLLSMWDSMDGDYMFSPLSWEGSLTGDSAGYKWMNKPFALATEYLSL